MDAYIHQAAWYEEVCHILSHASRPRSHWRCAAQRKYRSLVLESEKAFGYLKWIPRKAKVDMLLSVYLVLLLVYFHLASVAQYFVLNRPECGGINVKDKHCWQMYVTIFLHNRSSCKVPEGWLTSIANNKITRTPHEISGDVSPLQGFRWRRQVLWASKCITRTHPRVVSSVAWWCNGMIFWRGDRWPVTMLFQKCHANRRLLQDST